ncbi:unnamed protein product, partial [Natator depressus]
PAAAGGVRGHPSRSEEEEEDSDRLQPGESRSASLLQRLAWKPSGGRSTQQLQNPRAPPISSPPGAASKLDTQQHPTWTASSGSFPAGHPAQHPAGAASQLDTQQHPAGAASQLDTQQRPAGAASQLDTQQRPAGALAKGGIQPPTAPALQGALPHQPQHLVTAPKGATRSAEGTTMALLKLSLMAFSFVFWAAGLTMLTLGIWAKISLGSYLVLSANHYPNTPFILLATGAAVLVWGFLGCFSAATEHGCLLRTYAAFQLAVLAAGLAAGLSALFYRRDMAEGFRAGLREAVRAYGEDEQKADALDSLQRALDCCGAESYRDWLASPWSLAQPGRNGSVPGSCCRARRGCQHSPLPPDARGIHRDGCFAKVSGFVSDNLFYIATAALGLALLQGVGIVLACLLAARLRAAPR